jgi:hypothetical protein
VNLRFALACFALFQVQATPQKAKIYQDLADTVAGPWIYDDLASGYATAKKAGKPMLVAFR